MIRRNSRGDIIDSRRSINTRVVGELLIGDGWESVAHSELKALAVTVGIYHQQLKDQPGYEQTGQAIEALEKACTEIAHSARQEYREGSRNY
jgi:hypothetical protein